MEQTYILEKSESEKQGWGVAPVDLWERFTQRAFRTRWIYPYDITTLKCGMKFVMEIHMP